MSGTPSGHRQGSLPSEAVHELEELRARGLRRNLRLIEQSTGSSMLVQGKPMLDFSSNDYLGLATSAHLKEVMTEAVARHGVGSGASRLVCGNHAAHEELEDTIANFKHSEAALAFSSGHATAIGTIPAICSSGDTVILDKLSHASLIDGARLSGATIRVFPHNHTEKLERLLSSVRHKDPGSRVLIVTESIFSMDGDAAPLKEIVELKDQFGAWLMVDEAHGVGVLGPQGRGLVASLGLEDRVELQMGTLSKAIGVSGGYVASARPVIDLLINRARSLIYSTAPPPAVAATASASLKYILSEMGDQLRAKLHRNKSAFHTSLYGGRTDVMTSPAAAIIPLIIGDETAAMEAALRLQEQGYFIPAIRYPTVARGTARLRITLSALHELVEIEGLVTSLHTLMSQLGSTALEKVMDQSAT